MVSFIVPVQPNRNTPGRHHFTIRVLQLGITSLPPSPTSGILLHVTAPTPTPSPNLPVVSTYFTAAVQLRTMATVTHFCAFVDFALFARRVRCGCILVFVYPCSDMAVDKIKIYVCSWFMVLVLMYALCWIVRCLVSVQLGRCVEKVLHHYYYHQYTPKGGRPDVSDVTLLSGLSGLSFDYTFQSQSSLVFST